MPQGIEQAGGREMTYRSETRIYENRFQDTARVLAPVDKEEWSLTPQECADEHLYAELQGRWVQQRPMPYRVEVRVWQDKPEGAPAASAGWDAEHGVQHPGITT
jgi:hypothetical protein